MNKWTQRMSALFLSLLLLCGMAFPAAAADRANDVLADAVVEWVQDSGILPLTDAARVIGVRRLTDEELEAISDKLCAQSNVKLVELKDGRYTYYIAVDFRMEDGEYFARPAVLRKTSHKLYDRTQQMAQNETECTPVLMDYTHIVGEITLHFVVFRVTDSLGGESLTGVLGRLYRSAVVADLNIDENRFPILIRIVGLLIGE